MAGEDFHPAQVTFTLARYSDVPEFERFFGCPVEFSAPADQFTLSNENFAIPLITEDHHLLEILRPICEEAAEERKTVRGTVRSLVENEVQKMLHHGKANRQRVAKALGLSERRVFRGVSPGEHKLRPCRRSSETQPCAPVREGAAHFARANCLVAWL